MLFELFKYAPAKLNILFNELKKQVLQMYTLKKKVSNFVTDNSHLKMSTYVVDAI